MTSMRKRTLRGSVAARDALVNSITNLFGVAEIDVTEVIPEESDPMLERERRRLVEALVDRMLFDDEILLDWIGEEQDDDEPWNSTDDDTPGPTVDDYRAFEEAMRPVPRFVTGDRVVDAKGRAAGTVTGRDADDATRVRVKWDELPESWAHVQNLDYAQDQRGDK